MNGRLESRDIWVVIPAHNEQATLRALVLDCLESVSNLIVVNDASTDSTGDALENLPVTMLHNPIRHGKAYSLWHGFDYAMTRGATAIITLDGDGQHAATDLSKFLACNVRQANALIVGVRDRNRAIYHPLRFAANLLADWTLGCATGQSFLDSQCGYRLYPADLLRRTRARYCEPGKLRRSESFVFESEILLDASQLGYPIQWIALTATDHRTGRASHFRPWEDSFFIARRVIGRLAKAGLGNISVRNPRKSHTTGSTS